MKWTISIMALGLIAAGTYTLRAEAEPAEKSSYTNSPHSVQVTLLETGEDGKVKKTVGQETIWAMEDFWAEYKEYQLIDMNEQEVIFEKKNERAR